MATSEVYVEPAVFESDPERPVLVDNDVGVLREQKRTQLAQSSAFERTLQRMRTREAAKPEMPGAPRAAAAGAEAESPPAPDASGVAGPMRSAGRVAKDVALGVVESPLQIGGGIIEAAQNTMHMGREFNDWVSETVSPYAAGGPIVGFNKPVEGGMPIGPFSVKWATGDEIKDTETIAQALLPEVDPADTVTGGFVRGVSKFLAGFVGAGKLAPVRALSGAGRAGAVAAPFVRGAIADLAAFEAHENRLSNLVQEFPALQNPVSEYLASDPADGAAEGRFKNALEGLGIGGVTELAGQGLRRGIDMLRAGRAANTSAEPAMRQLLETADTQRETLDTLLGGSSKPDAPLFEVRPAALTDDEAVAAAGAIGRNVTEAPPNEVFVNWSRINAPEDVKAVIQDMANAHAGSIDEARRGVRTWTQTKEDAATKDAWKILSERRVGQPLEAAETHAVRELWVRSGTQLRDLSRSVAADPSDLNIVAFRKMLATHNAIQEQVVAARTETARALNAWRIPAGDSVEFLGRMDELRGVIRSEGRDTVEIAHRLNALTSAGLTREADQFVYGSALAKGSDMVRQLFYGALLSSPHTHARNMIGNSAMLPLQLTERKVASLIGKVTGSQNIPDGETSAALFGLGKGIRDAFRINAAKARMALGRGSADDAAAVAQPIAHLNRLELPEVGAFSAEKIGVNRDLAPGVASALDWIDSATRAPMTALGAADDAFSAMTWNMEISAQAFRKARSELDAGTITRDAFADRLATLTNNPDQYSRLAADVFRKRSTFTQEPGPFASAMMRTANKVPVLGRLVLPFRRTPFNIASETFQRTPLAPLVGQWRADMRAGGAQADLAMAKMATGTAILFAMGDLALSGDITGNGPENPAEREKLVRQGWKPNSVRVPTGMKDGEQTYRYFQVGRGLEPISTPIGLAANIVDILKYKDFGDDDAQMDELVMAATLAIAANATSQTYMSGLSDFFDAMSDPTRYGESWFQRLATIPVPRGVGHLARVQDPYARQVETMTDAIKAQIPGLSKTLPLARDVFGRPISRASGLGSVTDFVNPVASSSTENAQPIDAEMDRLELSLSKPAKKTSFDGVTMNLETRPEIYSRFVELAGNAVTEGPHGEPITARGFVSSGGGMMDELNALVTGKSPWSPLYDMPELTYGPDGGKAQQIQAIQRAYVEAAKAQVLKEFPAFNAEVEARKAEQPQRYNFGK